MTDAKKTSVFEPVLLEIFVTTRCNLDCTYCSSRELVSSGEKTITLKRLTRAIDLFSLHAVPQRFHRMEKSQFTQRVISFTGGEPMLEFGLLREAVNYIRNKSEKFTIIVNTN